MTKKPSALMTGLLATVLLVSSGCVAHWHHLPDDCAGAFYECEIARAVHNLCSGEPYMTCGCGNGCLSESCPTETCSTFVEDACIEPFGCLRERPLRIGSRVESGPPPVSYRPPMPPDFLLVPTRPVFSSVNMSAPEPVRGSIEVEYGPQLGISSRD